MARRSLLTLCLSAAVSTACTQSAPKPQDPSPVEPLNELRSLSITSIDQALEKTRSEGGRLDAVRMVAKSTGISHGRRWRQRKINQWLKEKNEFFATVFNFEQILLDGVYLPPRVDQVKGHVEKTQDGALRFTHQSYRIASEPTLVTDVPTYLNYLYQRVDPIEPPNRLALPKEGTGEVQAWQEAILEGWKIGVRQANLEFEADKNLLVRDYSGMMRYLDLVAKGLISKPDLSAQNFGVMISADGKRLNLSDEVVAIEREPTFQHHARWDVLAQGRPEPEKTDAEKDDTDE